MDGNKIQPYKYSLKCAAVDVDGAGYMCGDTWYFYIVPPEDALTIENIRTHLCIQFDSAVPSAFQKLERVGIINTYPGLYPITHKRTLTVNKTADANRIIDLEIDLSKLLKKDNVDYWNGGAMSYPENATLIVLEFAVGASSYNGDGTLYQTGSLGEPGGVLLWKTDALFTTQGIR